MPEFALGDQEVRDIETTLAVLAEQAEPIDLRFTNHWIDDDERPAILAAALLGSLEAKRVTVDAVDEEAVDGLLRFGVATALARRSEDTTKFVGRTKRLEPSLLRTLWTPASVSATDALFSGDEMEEIAAYGPRHATFVNPHLSSAADGHPDIVFLIRRWLTKRLLGEEMTEAAVLRLVDATAGTVDEAIRNVREHAASPKRPSPNCLLRLSVESPGQIRCSIFDTGMGLSTSLEEKGIEPELEPAERIGKLLSGEIDGWDAGRGTGLAYAAELIDSRNGRITIATGNIRVRRENAQIERQTDGFALQGTVIDFTIPTN